MAIVFEIAGTSLLRASNGFSRMSFGDRVNGLLLGVFRFSGGVDEEHSGARRLCDLVGRWHHRADLR